MDLEGFFAITSDQGFYSVAKRNLQFPPKERHLELMEKPAIALATFTINSTPLKKQRPGPVFHTCSQQS